MNVTGNIVVNKHRNQLGNLIDRIDYEWRGGRYAYVDLDFIGPLDILPKIGMIIKIGPFNAKIIEIDCVMRRVTILRFSSIFDYLRYVWHRSNKILDLAYRRLIITAAVWNIGYFNNATVPSWRDLYIAHWLKRTFKK